MRMSVNKDDSGYINYLKFNYKADVYLDGVKQKGCVMADEEEGLITRHILDENGNPKIDKDKQELMLEDVRGKVRIKIKR